ncbi:hypothetical protein BS1321_04465 [Peribacillus simplex NBRC 15720 = DSM 1321]|uniref:Uncharacterized protein n=1 Tax=Peribacillus simplex NBRC 15720 = DSM 1321 TaxID=1349754 RepID=A0A223EDJ8_9BACI|nr:hypothetical protein BS1321_04465 [Peribacillus simplex NBRC 15720 = DSM 1321]
MESASFLRPRCQACLFWFLKKVPEVIDESRQRYGMFGESIGYCAFQMKFLRFSVIIRRK